MGFLRTISAIISGIKSMRAAGDNFRFIAQNIATIYYIIDNSQFGSTLNDSQKLFATALIDTYVDISKGNISIEDIVDSVYYGIAGIVYIFPYSRQNSVFDIREHKDLINVTMQLEALIFNIDTNVNPSQIIDEIFLNKDGIDDIINTTIDQGKNSPLYKNMFQKVTAMIEDIYFQQIVTSQEKFQDNKCFIE